MVCALLQYAGGQYGEPVDTLRRPGRSMLRKQPAESGSTVRPTGRRDPRQIRRRRSAQAGAGRELRADRSQLAPDLILALRRKDLAASLLRAGHPAAALSGHGADARAARGLAAPMWAASGRADGTP